MVSINKIKKGQRVVYVAPYSNRETGVVSSCNDQYVFVKFDNRAMKMTTGDEPYTSKACKPEDLEII